MTKRVLAGLVGGLLLFIVGLGLAASVAAGPLACPPDSVPSGTICIDKYEASVWDLTLVSGLTRTKLVKKILDGTVTQADLTGAGAVQRGVSGPDYGPGCPDTGNGCVNFYAVSIPGVLPSASLTWFQAAAAARNSGKRLPTNQEWQVAALGTPDGTPCNETPSGGSSGSLATTGSAAGCVSDVGAFDMVGNLWEWVADWVPRSIDAFGSWGSFSDNFQALVGAATDGAPGALIRGGDFTPGGSGGGVFAVDGGTPASFPSFRIGFRAAR